jgi:hypothetical protein
VGRLDDLKKTFESTFQSTRLFAGVCGVPDQAQVKQLLEHGENLTKIAKNTSSFANSAQMLGKGGDQLAGAADALEKAVKGIGDVNAACEISQAISVLNEWSMPNTRVSNEDAAKAFDKLFGAAGRYMGKLPPPANAYANILNDIGKYNFFANMQGKMMNSSERRQLEQLEKDGF